MERRALTASSVGADRLEDAWRVIVDGVGAGAYAGAVALVARRGVVELDRATGWAMREPERLPMTEATIYDLASLTKVAATLPAILLLVDRRALTLDDPVGNILPEFGTVGWK